jgi:N-acetylmuramoyl-L-alanine amidase
VLAVEAPDHFRDGGAIASDVVPSLVALRRFRSLRGPRLWRLSFVLLVWGIAMFSAAQCPAAERARVTEIARYAALDAARIVVYVSETVEFQPSSQPNEVTRRASPGQRFFVDIPGVDYVGPSRFELQGLVSAVHVAARDAQLRVSLDLTGSARCDVFFLPEPFRIVIDVVRQRRLARRGAERELRRIALDPGHGGTDTGAVGPHGVVEKDVVLDIAHRTAPLLARELGISTLLTRDTDDRVALEERVAKANAFGADLFISIHCNADPSGTGRGVISFVLDGTHDHHSVHLLELENAAPLPEPGSLQRFLQQFDHGAAAALSMTFARLLQRATVASLADYPETVDAGVRGAGFYVLAGAHMPAVLFETSFVSNLLEEQRLGSPRYRQKLADAIINAVRAYRAGY